MVKVKGPIASAEAAGSFGGSAVFSRWKGRAYVRTKVTPTNPKSALQVANREMLAFLSQRWKTISDPDQATWFNLAFQKQVSFYHAYVAMNLDRWRQFTPPSQVYPPTESGTLPELDAFGALPGVAHIQLQQTWYDRHDAWGLLIFRSQTPAFATSRQTLITVQPLLIDDGPLYDDQNLLPGTYYYNFRSFTTTGKISNQLGQITGTAT
jgi:hypothetical protein